MIDTVIRWVIATVCVAGLVHIFTVLEVPDHARHRAFSGIDRQAAVGKFLRVGPEETSADLDPAFLNAVCRFDADTGPVRVTGRMPAAFWSVAAFSDEGRVLSTFSSEDLRGTDLDLLVGRTAALDVARQAAALGSVDSLPLPVDTGFVLVRLFAGGLDDAGATAAEAFAGLSCRPAVAD